MKKTKALWMSVISLVLCISMLAGTTFAWFTDSVHSGNNRIVTGNLDVGLEYWDGAEWAEVDTNTNVFEENTLWEPGHTEVVYLKASNLGTLALNYKLGVNIASETPSENVYGEEFKLSDHIQMGVIEDVITPFTTRDEARAALTQGVKAINQGYACEGKLYPANAIPEGELQEKYICLVVYMPETVGNEANYKVGAPLPEILLGIDLQASQQPFENDSFDNMYDILADESILVTDTKTLEEGAEALKFTLVSNGSTIARITVPAAAIADATQPVTVIIDGIAPSEEALVDENTKAYSYDISVSNLKEELSEEELVTVVVTAPNALAAMNAYHNGELIENAVYDEVNGTITFKTGSFSPYDFTYTEVSVASLAELRAAVKRSDVEIKLTSDLTIDLTAGSADRSEEHVLVSGSKTYHNAVNIIGQNVAINLNGHKLTVKCSDTATGNQDVGALFFVDQNGSLNIIDRAGTGYIKMASSIYMVWAPYDSPSYMDIYSGVFIADSYAGDPIGTSTAPGSADGTMKNENSNRALVYAGTGGNMNIYGGYFLYNNTPNDVLNRNNGAFNATNGYEGTDPFITIHDGVMLIDKAYRQDPTNTSEFKNILKENPNAKPTDEGIMDNSSIKLAKDCEIAKVDTATVKVIDGKAYSSWYAVIKGASSISAEAKKAAYNIGYEFTADDFNVYVFSANGSGGIITDFAISQVDTTTAGDKVVTVTYTRTDGSVLTTQCTASVLSLNDSTNAILAPTNELNRFMTGNFNVSGWANIDGDIDGNKIAEPSYSTMVGKTFNARNGETATGFNVDIVNGTYGENYYDLTITNAKQFTTLGINCLVGYSDTTNPIKGFGCYIDDDRSTLTYNAPAIVYIEAGQTAGDLQGTTYQADANVIAHFGTNNAYSLTTTSCASFMPGRTYTVHWVVVFEDGLSELCQWTVKMADATGSDAIFTDTAKPNANVIIMAGQSNMFGATPLTQTIKNQYADYTFDNVYIKYNNINFDVNSDGTPASTLHSYFSNDDFEKYKLGIGGQGDSYFGPETALAGILSTTEGLKEEQWFIIKYAAAGTVLNSQWTSGCTIDGKNTNLTDDMLDYVQEAIDSISSEYDVLIQSFMWMQGESDACDPTWASNYAGLEKNLVERVRNRFAVYAKRPVGSIPGSGISFVNAGIAINDDRTPATDENNNLVANGGPNNWLYATEVNTAKIGNSQRLCSVVGAGTNEALTTGPLKGYTFGINNPTIYNPNQSGVIANSIFIDTHHLLSKLASESEHDEYVVGDRTDWAHYGAASMNELGSLFASCLHYLMITEPTGPVQYQVAYNANGGTISPSSTYAYAGETIELPEPTREGYTFTAWSDGTTTYEAGESYTVTGNVTLTAQWEKVAYTITVKTSNATVSGVTNGQTAYYGDTISFTVQYTQNGDQSTTVTDANGNNVTTTGSYTFTMPASNVTINASSENTCVTADTLITLADGTQKRVDQLKATDMILAWDFFTGAYVQKEISLLVNHGTDLYRVANLKFSDGAMLRIIGEHGIFDYDLNKFVYITADNMNEYVGHRFVKYAADGSYDVVTLTKAYETEEYTSAWSVSSAITSNAFASGLLTVAPPEDFYNWIEMDGKLHYDVEQFENDVQTYGLYTYETFADYVTYEQFVAWNGAYLKIPVEKGLFTFEYILELIDLYKGWMPNN